MKFFSVFTVLAASTALAFGSFIELGFPQNGANFHANQEVTAQVILPESMASCIDVGIALAINNCQNGVCPQPSSALGDVLYAGPFTPTNHGNGKFFQNITVTLPDYVQKGEAIFSLTHLCLAGARPTPFLEYRNATVNIV
ncbi:hypothetical protein BJ138DRAFT_206480 [Hygrophoropsis aurantiaca]|uniref:Uncharacterized protein n=1 Tax=Hygrophoropsis aurantiaca TaxID=72124 RepID=A0ACB8AA83_9AGAM|nr:hypothetical protein BJ138DRAFT_206480 [Hygrophoropsis aurantiaca]